MMVNKLYILALALTGCASVYAIRHYSRRQEAQQLKEDLQTWEGEGGKPVSPAMRPAQAS